MGGYNSMQLVSELGLRLKSAVYVRMFGVDQRPGFRSFQEIGYSHTISWGDGGRGEMLAFHWDETSEAAAIKYPHLHLGSSIARIELGELLRRLHKLHIPTGPVSFPMVVRFLIEELKVEPLRADWDRILADADQA